MKIDTEDLIDMAPAFLLLGEELSKINGSKESSELSGQLIETSLTFSRLPTGYFDLECFTSDRAQFLTNISELAKVARAAGNPARRDEEILVKVGEAADNLDLNEQFSRIATRLVRLLVNLPGESSD